MSSINFIMKGFHMISLIIKDNRAFMSHLLIKPTFDSLLLSEAAIATANTYTISGAVNPEFYTTEELEELDNRKYSTWQDIKPFCFSLVKGSKTPTTMKIVFLLPDALCSTVLESSSASFSLEDINGLFLNVRYHDGQTLIVTGTSLSTFSMDKSLDKAFDEYVRHFLANSGIDFEEA